MNNSINLLGHKDRNGIKPASGKLKLLRTIAMLLLFGVSAASIVLYILISFSALPQVQQQERQALQTLFSAHPDMTKIALIEDRLAGITTILSQRSKYDTFLDSLAAKMPAGITMQQVSMKEKNVSVTVRSESLETLNIFLDQLVDATGANKDYAQVILNNINSEDTNNTFSMTISFVLP